MFHPDLPIDRRMQLIKPGNKIEDFLILRLIAKGGMGEVYEAYEQTLDRKVALKVVSQSANNAADLIRRFKREARILAKVNHPNIVTVYSIKAKDDLQYLSMELVEGVSFKDFLMEYPLSLPMALSLFQRSLAAVQVVHNLNIIHRDLKPSNILFTMNGEIKILDFGIAMFNGADSDKGIVVGSPPYMAPELNDGYSASWSTECWSLGTILYELITREMLFRRVHEGAVVMTDADKDMIPESVLNIIEKACAKDPKARYENIEEFMTDLTACASEMTEVTDNHKLRLQAQVKELLNRARCMIDTQIASLAVPQMTMLQTQATKLVPPPMPKIPDNINDISASTIVHKKKQSTAAAQPPPNLFPMAPKPRSPWVYAVPAIALIVGAGYLAINFKPSADSVAQSSQVAPKAVKAEEPKSEVKAEPPKAAEPVAAADGSIQQLSPAKDEYIFAEKKRVEFKWNQNLKAKDFRLEIASDANFEKIVVKEAISGNSFAWKKPLKSGTYFWRLWPVNSAKTHSVTSLNFFMLDTKSIQPESPRARHEFNADTDSGAQVEFKWECKAGIDHYQIEIANDENFAKPAGTMVDKGCSWATQLPAGSYFWRVKSAKAVNNSDFASSAIHFKVNGKSKVAGVPTAPILNEAILTRVLVPSSRGPAAAADTEKFELHWKGAKNAASYQYQVAKDKNFSEVVLDKKVSAENAIYAVNSPGTTYFRVRGIASDGAEGPYSRTGQMNAFITAPKMEKNYNLTVGAGTKVDWEAVPSVKNYLVQIGKKSDFSDASNHVVGSANYEVNQGAGNYFVRVAAADAKNEIVSDFSNAAKVKVGTAKAKNLIKLVAPGKGAKAPTRNGQVSIEFSWKPQTPSGKYVLELSTDQNFGDVLERVESVESRFLVEKISQTGRLYWRVKAEGSSDWSEASFLDIL